MSGKRPLDNELLQAADLSASPVGSRKMRHVGLKHFLLAGLLMMWSLGVYVFFTRSNSSQDQGGEGRELVVATATPPQVVQQQTPDLPPKPGPLPQVPKVMVRVLSNPQGATVLLDKTFAGQTPLELEQAEGSRILWFQLSGYESVAVPLDQEKEIVVDLVPIRARVWVAFSPKDSRIYLDGELKESPQEGFWDLSVRSHELKVSAPGFETQTVSFTPAEAYERKIAVTLTPVVLLEPVAGIVEGAKKGEIPSVQGLEMLLPTFPLEADIGSPRGTSGRQSNEVQIKVKLSRAFKISKSEITNAQFRAFKPEHNSGRWKGVDLNGDTFPVSGVTWEAAVEYCNWLSQQEGLPPAYRLKDGRWEFQEKPGTGYRLPTEAEWESLARMEVKQALFGWGDEMPPPQATVNIAGKESAKLFANSLPAYSDRFAGPAPVDQAGEGPLGLLGLYGNVYEWVQDAYSIPPATSRLQENPLNSANGKFHVMKGASWQDSGIGDLRIARRRYGNQSEVDLGFRVARYL